MTLDALTNHVTAFVDLLGFKDALSDSARLDKVLDITQTIQANVSDFKTSPNGDMPDTGSFKPAFSAFSDHFLVSMPCTENALFKDINHVAIFPSVLAIFIARIASAALQCDLLIRGGLAKGGLFHDKGIAFGPALVRAYEIESKESFYPRVVIANDVYGEIETQGEGQFHYFRDIDGCHCIDYIKIVLAFPPKPFSDRGTPRSAWRDEIRSIGQRNLATAIAGNKHRAIQNWNYFCQDVERAIATLDGKVK